MSDYVTYIRGRFEALLEHLPGPMDLCYLDASSHRGVGRVSYAKLALKHMAPGGIIAVDDVAGDWPGAKTIRRMGKFYLPQHRGLALIVA